MENATEQTVLIKKGLFQGCFPPDLAMDTCLKKTADLGFDGIEVTMEDPSPLLEEALNESTEEIVAIGKSVGLSTHRPGGLTVLSSDENIYQTLELANRQSIRIHSIATMMLFFYPLSSSNHKVRDRGIEIVLKMLRAAAIFKANTILTVPGLVTPTVGYREVYQRSREVLRDLVIEAEKLGVTVAIENVWNRFLLSPLEMLRYIDEFQSPNIGAYLDVANVLPFGYPDDWLRILGQRVKAIHFKDFRKDVGTISGFTHLLHGDVNWPALRKALHETQFKGFITVEIPPFRFFTEKGIKDAKTSLDLILDQNNF